MEIEQVLKWQLSLALFHLRRGSQRRNNYSQLQPTALPFTLSFGQVMNRMCSVAQLFSTRERINLRRLSPVRYQASSMLLSVSYA